MRKLIDLIDIHLGLLIGCIVISVINKNFKIFPMVWEGRKEIIQIALQTKQDYRERKLSLQERAEKAEEAFNILVEMDFLK